MPPRPRRTSFRPVRRARRRLVWADFTLDGTTSVGFTVIQDVLNTYRQITGASLAGATVARIHVRVWITNAVTTGDGIAVSFICDRLNEVVASPGVVNTTAHLLSPVANPMADWQLYQRFNAHPQYDFHGGTSANLEFDVKSKRHLREMDDTQLIVIDNIDAAGTIDWSIHVRTLLMLA